jgi:chromosome segregation ATPase
LQHSGENAPDYLRQQVEIHKAYIEELEAAKQHNLGRASELEAELQEAEKANNFELQSISRNLDMLTAYVEAAFANLRETRQRTFPSIFYIAIDPAELPDRTVGDSGVNQSLNTLKDALKGLRAGVAQEWDLMMGESETLKKELADTRDLKEEIMMEVSRFKTLLEEQERNIKETEDENTRLKLECSRFAGQCEQQKAGLAQATQSSAKTIKDVLDSLTALTAKYEGVDFVATRVNLHPVHEANTDLVY